MGAILGWALKQLAEGKFGSGPQRVWLWLQGKKTIIAALLATIAATLQAAQSNGTCALVEGVKLFGWPVNCGEAASALLWLSGILALVGLTDGALRMEPPKAPQPKANDARGFGSRLALAAMAIGSLLLLSACGSMAQLRLGEQRPLAPDPEVVEQLVCRGQIADAERYVELRSGSMADRVELIERAFKHTKSKPGCCAAEGKCGGGQPGSSLIVTP